MTVRAEVALDLPSCDTKLLSAGGEVARWAARTNKMIPAMLAWKHSDAQLCDAHGDDVFK